MRIDSEATRRRLRVMRGAGPDADGRRAGDDWPVMYLDDRDVVMTTDCVHASETAEPLGGEVAS